MDNNGYVPDNIPADLGKSWHIPRPTLARSSRSSQSSTSSNNSTQSARSGSLLLTAANLAQIHQLQDEINHQTHGASKPNDNLSTRDKNIQYYIQTTGVGGASDGLPPKVHDRLFLEHHHQEKQPDPDSISVASSMHFTVVNVNTRPTPPKRSCCRRHQLTILVMTMSTLFTLGILTAIFLLEMRAKNQKY